MEIKLLAFVRDVYEKIVVSNNHLDKTDSNNL